MKKLFRKLITVLVMFSAAFVISSFTYADEAPQPDFIAIMTTAARQGDISAGREAARQRNAYIDEHLTGETKISFDDLYLLAQFINAEAGSDWISDEMRICVGEVALNRLASPEYPSSLERVIFQRGQFACVHDLNFSRTVPNQDCVSAALRLMEGERMMEAQVIYFGAEPEGEIYNTFVDKVLGYTYFCKSPNSELYAAVEPEAYTKDESVF